MRRRMGKLLMTSGFALAGLGGAFIQFLSRLFSGYFPSVDILSYEDYIQLFTLGIFLMFIGGIAFLSSKDSWKKPVVYR